MTSQNTALKKTLRKLIDEQVSDILLFGSIVRGKKRPNDSDILVIFKKAVDKEKEYQIRKEAEKYLPNVSIISKNEDGLQDDSFDAREGVLFEGTSIITGNRVAGRYGYMSLGLFKYDFSDWTKLQKTKFYYALNGRRGKSGVSEALGGIKLSDNVLLIPLDKIEAFRDFLDTWKLNYQYIPVLIPARMARKQILEFT